MKLITEDRFDVKWSNTEENNGRIYVEGIFSSADIINENGRRYKRSILEREIEKYQKVIQGKSSWGELQHPSSPTINPDRIAIMIESLEWEGNNVIGKAKVLDTPKGQITKILIKEGNVGISSRGLGTVNSLDSYVNDDFNLITYDCVTSPSNPESWLKGIYEGREFDIITPKIVEPEEDQEKKIKEAKGAYYKHIWQVIEDIERSM